MSNQKAASLHVLLLLAATVALVATAMAGAAAQRAPARAARATAVAQIPPISQTCPMHPDVVESAPGSCPICQMKLVPVRLESVWSCPLHPVIAEHTAGACPICKRPLVQMTMALTWTCSGHPEIDRIEPGLCADGSAAVRRRTLRPHGNHNPQHGGQFFMAPDNTHHLEGAYPRERVFRLYLYDDFARPLPAARLKAIKARVVTKETFDATTRTTREIAVFPLTAVPAGGYLEARIDRAQLPAQMSAKVRFTADAPEYRFDFAFATLSRDPAPAATRAAASGPAARPAPRPAPRRAAPAGSSASSAGDRSTAATPASPAARVSSTASTIDATTLALMEADPSLVAQPIPDNLPEIVAHLQTRTRQIGELIDRGNFAAVYVPAFQAKDLAIALEGRLDQLPPERRQRAEPAIGSLVRHAWLLDAVGDLGNREQITAAYRAFYESVAEVVAASGGPR